MHSYSINKLLDLKDVIIKNIVHGDHFVKIFLETIQKEHICPCCGSKTSRVHDYRIQEIKDLPFQLKHTILVLRKRRYLCTCCKKRFAEHYDFLARYQQRTRRLTLKIVQLLHSSRSVKSVAEDLNLSVHTITRVLDTIGYTPSALPTCLSIDEFKGDTDAGKYQCILVDASKKQIYDVLPNRTQSHLSEYFRNTSRNERYRVKFFICDMWQPYVDLAKSFFPNATIIIDKYHFIRQVTWAIESVRKRIQKTMVASLRKYYKRSRRLILTRYHKLKDESKKSCDLMLLYNDDLRTAHTLKEWFYEICQEEKYSIQRISFWDWIKAAEKSGIAEFEKCAKTYRTWSKGILNAFKYKYTNGPTEGFNNKIKVLKRTCYGIRNFKRFRTRILHCTN